MDSVTGKDEMEILEADSVELLEEKINVDPRKFRATSVGVAELMKSLKAKKKAPSDKGKSKQVKAS